MNNTKFFIAFALVLAAAGAVSEIFYVFVDKRPTDNGITADTIQLLQEHLDIEKLDAFTNRAEKYLLLTAKQFEEGVDPATIDVNATPTVTPTPSL